MDQSRPVDMFESSLFDRLISGNSEHQDQVTESQTFSVVSPKRDATSGVLGRRERTRRLENVRGQIERDLLFLLSTRQWLNQVDLKKWPHIQKSVLNYGITDLSGATASGTDLVRLAQQITVQVIAFEPRLHRRTLAVRCGWGSSTDELCIEINADFGPTDDPQTLSMVSVMCLSSGQIASKLAA